MTTLPPIHLLSQVDSTNDIALNQAAKNAPHGSCWVANQQLAGRGRRNIGGNRRQWFSPISQNIYMSLLIRPTIDVAKAAGLTLASAVAICETLRNITDLDIWIKWPNDIYIGAKKLGGILTEASSSGQRIDAIVIGVGLNINTPAEEVPYDLKETMTSLLIESQQNWDRMTLVFALYENLMHFTNAYCNQGFDVILPALKAYDRTKGRTVYILRDNQEVRAIAQGINPKGHLEVQLDNGEIFAVQAGEVRFESLSTKLH